MILLLCKSFFELVKQRYPNSEFYDAFLKAISAEEAHNCGASEYELYFNFMLIYFPEKILLRPLKWKNSTEYENQSDHDYVSVHWHMRETVTN